LDARHEKEVKSMIRNTPLIIALSLALVSALSASLQRCRPRHGMAEAI
jgi:hypothetical protein